MPADSAMMDFSPAGKMLVVVGAVTVLAGLILLLVGRVPFLGRLPGDITLRRGNVRCHIPIATSILLSLLLTLLLNLIVRLLHR